MNYFGESAYRTNCLVLMKEPLYEVHILRLLKKLSKLNPVYENSDSFAVTLPDCHWLGIDSDGLQQSVCPEIVKKVAKIVQAPVILYDILDGDMLTLGYGNAKTGTAYCRYAAGSPEVLEMFGYEQDGDFPEELLEFMECDKNTAKAVWFSPELYEEARIAALAKLMVKEPIPYQFIGKYDMEDLPKEARLTTYQGDAVIGSDGLDAETRMLKKVLPHLVKGVNFLNKKVDRRIYKGYEINLPPDIWTVEPALQSPGKRMRHDIYRAEYGTLCVSCTTSPFSMYLSDTAKRWDQTKEEFAAEHFNIPGIQMLFYECTTTPDSVIKEYKLILPPSPSQVRYRHSICIAKENETYSADLSLYTTAPEIIKTYEEYLMTFRLTESPF